MRLKLFFPVVVPVILAVAACVGPSEKPVTGPQPPRDPRPSVENSPSNLPRPAVVEWDYRSATPGNWSYSPESYGSIAKFTQPNVGIRLVLRCEKSARRISVVRPGVGRDQSPMTIRTTFGAYNWPAIAVKAPQPQMIAERAANDTVFDQIAYSRGKFAVEVAGTEQLILPTWGEVSRVIEDCRG